MELKDYTTEELRAELKKRNAEEKAKRESILRCRMCKHWGKINHWGDPLSVPLSPMVIEEHCVVNSSKQKAESIIDAIKHRNLLVKILKEKRNRYDKN